MTIRFLLAFTLLVSAAMGASTTGDLSLHKPASGDTGWGTLVNGNFDTIDAQVTDLNKGVWKAEAAFADADTTPSIGSGGLFRTANTGATTITDFDDPEDNPIIVVRIADANTTIADGSGIELASNVNTTFASGEVLMFYYDGTDFIQIGEYRTGAEQAFAFENSSITQSGILFGDGSDGAGPTSTGNLDTGDGKEYTTWNLSGDTITLTNGSSVASEYGYHYIAVQGTITFDATSSIVLDGTGNNGGAAGSTSDGSPGRSSYDAGAAGGGGGGGEAGSTYLGGRGGNAQGGIGGPVGAISTTETGEDGRAAVADGLWYVSPGALGPGGGGGGGGDDAGCGAGAGGDGGGLLVLEVGVLNFVASASISADGADGGDSSSGSDCGGGGGGGGGTVLIVAGSVTSSAGTISVAGGAAGSGTNSGGTGGDGGAGGAGRFKIIDLSSY